MKFYPKVPASKENKFSMDGFKLYVNNLEQKYEIKIQKEFKFDNREKEEIYKFKSNALNKNGKQREYRFDFAIPELKIGIEIDGGVWMTANGKSIGHAGGVGVTKDIEKCNLAQLLGWVVIRFTYQQQFLYVQEVLETIINNYLIKKKNGN